MLKSLFLPQNGTFCNIQLHYTSKNTKYNSCLIDLLSTFQILPHISELGGVQEAPRDRYFFISYEEHIPDFDWMILWVTNRQKKEQNRQAAGFAQGKHLPSFCLPPPDPVISGCYDDLRLGHVCLKILRSWYSPMGRITLRHNGSKNACRTTSFHIAAIIHAWIIYLVRIRTWRMPHHV